MGQSLRLIVSEPAVETPEAYARRVRLLAVEFLALFVLSLAGVSALAWRGRYLVTLTQRSNVETLTLAFFFVIFVYIVLLTSKGAWGATRIAWYSLPRGTTEDRERRKTNALPPPQSTPTAALNVLLVKQGNAGPFTLPVADAAGPVGAIEVDGARVTFRPDRDHGANNVLAYFVRQVQLALESRGANASLDVVAWKTIDDEAAERYLSNVRFAENLTRALKSEPLWPANTLTDADLTRVERALGAICPALRNESFLPDWEYSAEHKLPIIPEPLGLASLGRSEQRADPLVAMSMMLGMVGLTLGALLFLIFVPPWLPGA